MGPEKLLWISSQPQITDASWRQSLNDLGAIAVTSFPAAREAMADEQIACVLIAGEVPDLDPFDALEALRALEPQLPVVFWNPKMRAAEAVRLIRAGANHCFGSGDCLNALKEHLEAMLADRARQTRSRDRSAASREPWRNLLVGESRAMKTVAETIRLIGPRRCTVLISGETGTGKEMAARALHMASPRAALPMVAVNCSALPENLLEAELFGHVKGAFTGAINTRVGRFEQANKSTLFLDEIGDMPIELQAKLLRVLQDRELQRLGSSETVKVDVRVIAASNLNLLERVRQGKFREDLYYRLNVVPLQMPPLRQRAGDIALLAPHFVKKICGIEGIPLRRLSAETLQRLEARQWPGNVRELENAIEMAVAMSGDREELYASDFGLSSPALAKVLPMPCASATALELPESMDFGAAVSQFEQRMLEQALRKTAGNKTAAAELLGMKRTTLIMKLRNLDGLRTACVS